MKNTKITSKEDIKLFRREIKKKLKNILANVEDNLNGNFVFELYHSDDTSACYLLPMQDLCLPDFDIDGFMPIVIDNFMYGNGFNLNKYTSDYKLNKVVNRIIEDYNDQVDWEIECRRASEEIEYRKVSEEIEAEWRKKYGMV